MSTIQPPPGETTTPGPKTQPPKPPKEPKAAKPKTEKADGEKKERAPRQDYGFKPGAKITVTEKGEKTNFRGKRGEYFARFKNGMTVEEYFKACPQDDPPRGWLRFFTQNGFVELSGGEEPKKEKPQEEKKEATSAE